MKINRIIAAAVINVVLLPFTFGMTTGSQRRSIGLFDCCQEAPDGRYCCQNCCWLTHDCAENGGCNG